MNGNKSAESAADQWAVIPVFTESLKGAPPKADAAISVRRGGYADAASRGGEFAKPHFAGWTNYGYWHNGQLLNRRQATNLRRFG